MIPGVLGQLSAVAEDETTGGGGGTVFWNSADKHADITLSNGDLTATSSASGTARAVRSTASFTTGKHYFEGRLDAVGAGDFAAFGIALAGMGLTQHLGAQGGSAYSAGLHTDGHVWSGPNVDTDVSKPLSVAEWCGIAVDLDAGKMWVRDSAGWVGDPEAGTGNTVSFSLGGAAVFAAFQGFNTGDAGTGNFGFTAFAYTIPAGFTSWDGTQEGAGSGSLSGTATLMFTPTADLEIDSGALSGTTSLTFTPTADLDISGGHQFWRIVITAVGGDTFVSAAEIKVALTNGGANLGFQASGATVSAESTFSGLTAADGANCTITGNPWGANNDTSAWYKADFGSAKDVTSVGIYPHGGAVNQSPKDFVIEYSDDDAAWTTAYTPAQQTGWAAGVSRIFEWASAGTHRYWRLRTTTVDGGTNLAFQECIFGVSDGTCGRSGSGHTAVCTATSEFAGQGASRVFDNNTGQAWVNNGGSTATITFNFLRRLDLHEIKWTSQTSEGDRSPTAGTIEYSDDNSAWTSVYTISEAGWGSLEERTWQF